MLFCKESTTRSSILLTRLIFYITCLILFLARLTYYHARLTYYHARLTIFIARYTKIGHLLKQIPDPLLKTIPGGEKTIENKNFLLLLVLLFFRFQ